MAGSEEGVMIDQDELARRLKVAREASGLTQDQAAATLGFSRSKLALIETGRQGVSSVELVRFARAYGRGPESFFEEKFSEEETIAALFRSAAAATDEGRVVDVLRDCLAIAREFTAIEGLLGIARTGIALPAYHLQAPRTRYEATQQGERVAEAERRRLGLNATPVPDMIELLESQGVRTGLADLPDDIDGLTLSGEKVGVFVVVNAAEGRSLQRRRFSIAHEYAHVLLDRDRVGLVSRRSDRDELAEVRANAFAAAFLMPAEGVTQFLEAHGKGRASRSRIEVFDGEDALEVEGREAPGSQVVQAYEIVQLAHHFHVSRPAAIYRLLSLKHLTRPEADQLKQQDAQGLGRTLEKLLGLAPLGPGDGDGDQRQTFSRRFISLGLEAYRRGAITRAKLEGLATLARCPQEELFAFLAELPLAEDAVPAEVPPSLLAAFKPQK
jgi:Zn-dependent peptidase ImmA (M78 family)/transcriptional regulator with XRE-family HTH domain